MVVNYSYLGRLVRESIERELNLGHILRSFCYREFDYDTAAAQRILSASLREGTKGFIRMLTYLKLEDISQEFNLRQEYMVKAYLTCRLADKSDIYLVAYINWDFRFNRTLRSVSVEKEIL